MFDQYMYCLTVSIVDEVCIAVAKANALEESKEHGNQILPPIINEKKVQCGKYGWCIICRAASDMQCSKSNVAVCSEECLLKHLKMLDNADAIVKSSHQTQDFVEDSISVLNCISQLGSKDVKSPPSVLVKCRLFTLEVMAEIIENAPEALSTSEKMIETMKGPLWDGIMKNSVNTDKVVFQQCTKVFMSLILRFKANLKVEISVIIEEIFLKLLGSSNSLYHHKMSTLQLFNRIFQNPNVVIELFLNYDCDKKSKSILKMIIDSIARVIQSSSYKLESQEDTFIKNIALECVFNMLKSLSDYIKIEDKAPANALNNDPNQIEAPIEAITEEVQSGNYEQMLFEKNKISTAVLKFNMKPKAGIAYLLANKMIVSEPDDLKIADILKFIKENPDIDKGKIGEFFGEKDEFNKKALYNII